MLIKFRIRGDLRFLSHAETIKVFQRACVRAGIKTAYSQGFNPRPKLSLPLPRSVGVEVDEDLLSLRIQHTQDSMPCASNEPRDTNHESRIKARLSGQLPKGCELISVSVAKTKASFQPRGAAYVLTLGQEHLNEKLKARIKSLLASATLVLERRIDIKDQRPKTQDSRLRSVDVRPFLKSIEPDDRTIVVECKISSAGSIRIDEILKLLELDVEKLVAPIRRTSVQWQQA